MDLKSPKLNVPKIDISSLVDSNSTDKEIKQAATEIGKACKDWGFFYIVGHGIDTNYIEKVQRLTREFFNKSKEFKKNVARTQNNFRGWSDSELTKQKLDWKEVFDFGSEVYDPTHRDSAFDGQNRWPEGMEEFKSVLIEYFDKMHAISEKLMSAIFISLGVNPKDFEEDFNESKDTSIVRMNYYPICPNPNAQLGVGPHSDPSVLTILWQDLDVSSLQVEKDGKWYDVYPVPDSFVINIGDMVQVWSNGLYKAPVHRVLANHTLPRYSAPFFYTPSYKCNIKPLDTCISADNPLKYKPINWGHFRKGRFEGDYADVGEEIQISQFLIDQ